MGFMLHWNRFSREDTIILLWLSPTYALIRLRFKVSLHHITHALSKIQDIMPSFSFRTIDVLRIFPCCRQKGGAQTYLWRRLAGTTSPQSAGPSKDLFSKKYWMLRRTASSSSFWSFQDNATTK